jgi:hypothetical protein
MANRSSHSMSRRFSRPSPAIITAFSTDEWAWLEAYATSRRVRPARLDSKSVARSRAASNAHSVALDAVSWITPPPAAVDLKGSGRSSMVTSQSSTCVSSSVQAGLVAHIMPCTARPAESISPRIEGPDALAGKNAKKFGDCQCVIPGRMICSTSRRTSSKGSPRRGAESGSRLRISPGCT